MVIQLHELLSFCDAVDCKDATFPLDMLPFDSEGTSNYVVQVPHDNHGPMDCVCNEDTLSSVTHKCNGYSVSAEPEEIMQGLDITDNESADCDAPRSAHVEQFPKLLMHSFQLQVANMHAESHSCMEAQLRSLLTKHQEREERLTHRIHELAVKQANLSDSSAALGQSLAKMVSDTRILHNTTKTSVGALALDDAETQCEISLGSIDRVVASNANENENKNDHELLRCSVASDPRMWKPKF